MKTFIEMAWTVFTWPLKTIYRKGPRILYLWEGLGNDHICYELTKIDAIFWSSSEESMSACDELIDRKFEAFVISVYGFLFAYFAYTLFCIKLYEYVFVSRLHKLLDGGNKTFSIFDKDVSSKK